jgi:hypothetical protein
MSLSKYQLERADLTVTIEQGRRVEGELFAENSRGLQTMGELLKARMFGATEYAINLRKRMTNYVAQPAPGSSQSEQRPTRGVDRSSGQSPAGDGGILIETGSAASPIPASHSWPCDDPFCQPCEDGVKRPLRDVGVIPRRRGVK